MHDLLVGNAVNYSLLELPEKKAYIWCQINVLNKLLTLTQTQTRLRCRLSSELDTREKKYFNPSLWFSKQDCSCFVFVFVLFFFIT